MKIPTNKIEAFLQTINSSSVFSCLLHGPEYSTKGALGTRLAQAIMGKTSGQWSVISIDSDGISADGAAVYDEIFNAGLFTQQKLIKISAHAHHKLTPLVKTILQNKQAINQTFIIITLSESENNSELIRLYQTSDDLAAVACYPDDDRTSHDLISKFFRDNAWQAEDGVIASMVNALSGNRMLLMNELQKISLYLGESKQVTAKILAQVVDTVKSATIDECIDAICLKQMDVALNLLQHILYQEPAQNIIFIRSFVSHLLKLRGVLQHMADGCYPAEAIKKEAIFFKRVGSYLKQVQIWSLTNIDAILNTLLQIEISLKHHPEHIGRLMISHAIANINQPLINRSVKTN